LDPGSNEVEKIRKRKEMLNRQAIAHEFHHVIADYERLEELCMPFWPGGNPKLSIGIQLFGVKEGGTIRWYGW
jgi:hypothetical protein